MASSCTAPAGKGPPRLTLLSDCCTIPERRTRTRTHLAWLYLRFTTGADKLRLYRMAAGSMDQFDRRTLAARHPAVTPPDHHDDQWIEIDSLLRQPILEPARRLFVCDSLQDFVAPQVAQSGG